MKKSLKAIFFLSLTCIVLFTQCKMENDKKSQEKQPLAESEYTQGFTDYNLVVKTPIKLTDISNESKNKFALHYGAVEFPDDKAKLTAYQLMISIPSKYGMNKASLKENLLNSTNMKWGECSVGIEQVQGYVSSFVEKGIKTKSLAVFCDDYILGINVMSNSDLESKFKYVVDSIHFTKKVQTIQKDKKTTSIQPNFESKTFKSDKFTIPYPSHYEIIENPFPNVDVSFMHPSDGENYQANFNVVADMNNDKTLEEVIIIGVMQIKDLPYNSKIISNTVERINDLKYSKIVFNSVMMGHPVISLQYGLTIDKKLYIITFHNDKESYSEKEEKIINEIIHSFKPL